VTTLVPALVAWKTGEVRYGSRCRSTRPRGSTMIHSRAGDGLIIIDHTEVPAALRAAGSASNWSARRSRMRGATGSPTSRSARFAKAQIDRRPEWQDVLRRS
jgi:predicted GNAT family acetyltransferase